MARGEFDPSAAVVAINKAIELELELDLIQPHMTQKPVLQGEVDVCALRV